MNDKRVCLPAATITVVILVAFMAFGAWLQYYRISALAEALHVSFWKAALIFAR